jgi:hypothetical protein
MSKIIKVYDSNEDKIRKHTLGIPWVSQDWWQSWVIMIFELGCKCENDFDISFYYIIFTILFHSIQEKHISELCLEERPKITEVKKMSYISTSN